MAERLRRWTRNPMGSPRAGSNPARSGVFLAPIHSLFFVSDVSNNNYLFERSQKRRSNTHIVSDSSVQLHADRWRSRWSDSAAHRSRKKYKKMKWRRRWTNSPRELKTKMQSKRDITDMRLWRHFRSSALLWHFRWLSPLLCGGGLNFSRSSVRPTRGLGTNWRAAEVVFTYRECSTMHMWATWQIHWHSLWPSAGGYRAMNAVTVCRYLTSYLTWSSCGAVGSRAQTPAQYDPLSVMRDRAR